MFEINTHKESFLSTIKVPVQQSFEASNQHNPNFRKERCLSLMDKDTLQNAMEEIRAAIRNKNWRAADSRIHEYLGQVSNDPEALMYLGVSKAAQGYEPEGEHHLLASLTFNPRSKLAYYYLGIIVMEQGRCILASEAFRKGLSIDPTNQALLYQFGRSLERLGNYEEALDAYRRSLDSDPDIEISDEDFSTKSHEAIKRLKEPEYQIDAKFCGE